MIRSIGILVLLPTLCVGQQNLVPNPSFEDHTQCPQTISQYYLAIPWSNTGPFDESPDYYNVCNSGTPTGNPHMGVPANGAGLQNAHSGEAYMGLFAYAGVSDPDGRELIQVELTAPLLAGVRYQVEFHVSLADKFQYAVGSFGALFTDTMLIRASPYLDSMEFSPQIQSPQGFIFGDKENWMMVQDTFTSRYGGERFITIGNFKIDAESDTLLVSTGANNRFQSYYYIDDVSVVALDTLSGIEETKRLQFNVYPNPAKEFVQFKVEGSTWQPSSATVLDAVGRAQLPSWKGGVGGGQGISEKVDLHGLPSGIYFLQLTDEQGNHAVRKFVKE